MSAVALAPSAAVSSGAKTHLPGQRRNRDARALALEDVAEVLEIAVAPAHDRVAQLEGRDVGPGVDLVGGVHGAW